MKIVGIIPARGGSKGVPGKNKKHLCGKPLILYTIEEAKLSKLDMIVVTSDDEDILKIAADAGVCSIKRPAELAIDTTPTLPVIQQAIRSINETFDACMILQPTSPLRKSSHINDCINLFETTPDADSLVSVVKAPHKFTPNSLMRKNGMWLEHYEKDQKFLRRQEKPEFFGRNGAAIYITRICHLDNYILGGKIIPYEMDKLVSIDIDDMEDWLMAEILITNIEKIS